jgi:hypothetical protein
MHDHMDVGGRTMPGAIVEEVATHDSREGGGRIASGTAIEGAKAEERRADFSKTKKLNC